MRLIVVNFSLLLDWKASVDYCLLQIPRKWSSNGSMIIQQMTLPVVDSKPPKLSHYLLVCLLILCHQSHL